MRTTVFTVLSAILACCCSSVNDDNLEDNRFVVLGPSLVELMYASGLGSRIVGVDRYTDWPEETGNLPQVGGYIDPSLEQIVSLEPTSIHISGESPVLRELAATLGIPFYSYRFDNLVDVFSSLDSLDARYGAHAADFKEKLLEKLDSLEAEMESTAPVSVMIVIYHERGSSSMTVAGRSTFFADILISVNCEISAPGTGSWPMISAEGVIDLSPDHIICLFPGRTDTAEIAASEEDYLAGLGFEPGRVHCLFEPYIMIPGGRIGRIAERICSCLL
ncbi:MAG: ABC transporter substrate-binding protein [Candidatus Aegiribacteria sp.]|nr:ABC transporter substrate-binding protein [Candidatus Aegiribacteria sp.]